jgi:hypothetical protein
LNCKESSNLSFLCEEEFLSLNPFLVDYPSKRIHEPDPDPSIFEQQVAQSLIHLDVEH